jgi:hypothetical protein
MWYTFGDHLKTCIQPILTDYFLELVPDIEMVWRLVIDIEWMPRHIKHSPGSFGVRPNDLEVHEGIGPCRGLFGIEYVSGQDRFVVMGPQTQITRVNHNQDARPCCDDA